MERLTTDNPNGNFDMMLNYVYGQGGWACIRSGGDNVEPVLLTEWARKQCVDQGCENLPTDPEGIDQYIADCAFDTPCCPVFLAYTFAVQAVHLRDRLKQIEDILGDSYNLDHLRERIQAEQDGRLMMLPCKPGTELFGHCRIRGAQPISHSCYYPPYVPQLGVDAWLTREEAEAALEAQKGGGEG